MISSDENKKSNSSWAEVFKTAMGESTSLFVLVFSGVLVISSITAHAEVKIVLASFLTLFYAVINHYLAVFSKLESYRTYARGKVTFPLYVFISLLLFVGWVKLSTEVLLTVDIELLRNIFKVRPFSFFWIWFVLLVTLYVVWLSIIVYSRNKEEQGVQEGNKSNDNRQLPLNKKKIERGLVVVAHPDDEVLWTGGYLMRHQEYEWEIIATCYGKYLPRARAFVRSCHCLDVYEYKIFDFFDDFDAERLKEKLSEINFGEYAIVITHDPESGEYGNEDHKKVGKVVNELVRNNAKLLNFSYKNSQYSPQSIDVTDPTRSDTDSQEPPSGDKGNTDIFLFLTHEEIQKKLYILREVYIEQKIDFRNLAWPFPNPEAFRVVSNKSN